MKKKLTSRYVETVVAPGPKRLEVYDQTLSGFGIRVSVTGSKTWFCATRRDGRMKRMKIGTYPALSLAEARNAAKSTLRDTQLGIVPETVTPTLFRQRQGELRHFETDRAEYPVGKDVHQQIKGLDFGPVGRAPRDIGGVAIWVRCEEITFAKPTCVHHAPVIGLRECLENTRAKYPLDGIFPNEGTG